MNPYSTRPRGKRPFIPAIILLLILFTASSRFGLIHQASSAPVVTATKTDALQTDADGSGGLTPGDTVRYTVTLNNTGGDPATDLTFNDTPDSATTLSGTAHVSPIPFNDSYTSLGNVGITVPAASGVLINDVDPDSNSGTLTVTAASGSTGNGSYNIAADGSFTYTPAAGFEGTDAFSYTLSDSDALTPNATGTVTITISEVIWFIDNAAGAGNGTLASPFNTLAAYAASAREAGDIIFIYTGSGTYDGGLTLLNSQILIGQGATASIPSIAGITVPTHSNTLPSTSGSRPALRNTSGGNVLTLANGNTVRGLNLRQSSGIGLTGTSVGSQTISEMNIDGSTKAIDINGGGTVNLTLDQVQATNSANGGVSLQNITGGSTTLSNVNLTTTGGTGFLASSSNTLHISGTTNTIASENGTGIHLNNTTIGSNITFQSISSDNATNGISLQNTGSSGSFTVNGGSFALHTAEGIFLNNVPGGANFNNMTINQSTTTSTQGVEATTVTGLGFSNTTITAGGSNSNALLGTTIRNLTATNTTFDGGDGSGVANIDGVKITNLLGTSAITGGTVRDGKDINMLVDNSTNGGGQDTLTISGTAFIKNIAGDNLQIRTSGTANLKVVVQNNGGTNATFTGAVTDAISFQANGGTLHGIVTGATFTSNLGNVVNMATTSNGHLIARVHNLTGLTSAGSNVINAIAFDTSTIEATVENNTITSHPQGAGIRFILEGNGTVKAKASNNTISGNTQSWGIIAQPRAGSGRMDLTLNNNSVTNTGTLAFDGIEVTAGSSTNTDTNVLCLNMFNNTSSTTGTGLDGYFLRRRPNATFFLQDFSPPVATWVNTTKNNTGSVSSSGSFTNATAACATPTVPTASLPAQNIVVKAPNAAPVAAAPSTIVWDNNDSLILVSKQIHGSKLAPPPATSVELTIGTLPAGKSVTIIFDVTVNAITQASDLKAQICNQGVFDGDLGILFTDDPDVGGSSNPTCTSFQTGSLTIAKDQQPNGSTSFGFTSNISGHTTFNVTGDSNTVLSSVAPGSYTVTENDPSSILFKLTDLDCNDDSSSVASTTNTTSRAATVNLEPGESITCTFTNEESAKVEVRKVVLPAAAQSLSHTFDLEIDGSAAGTGNDVGHNGTTGEVGVTIGTHTIGESGSHLSNYNTTIGCEIDGTGTAVTLSPTNEINVAAGNDIVCTITNTHKTGAIEIVKDLYPTTSTDSFDLKLDGTTRRASAFDGVTTGEIQVLIGTHTVSETAVSPANLANYTTTIECKDNNGTGLVVAAGTSTSLNVPVAEGDDIVCTITNARTPTIQINKVVLPSHARSLGHTFDLEIDGSVAGTGDDVGHNGTTGELEVAVGTRTISESGSHLSNYTSTIGCEMDGTGTAVAVSPTGEINVAAGDDITCTITNTHKTGTINVVKDLYPATDSGTFNLQFSGMNMAAGAGPRGDGGSLGQTEVLVGNYTVSETADAPVNLADYNTFIECKDNNGTGTVVANGRGTSLADIPVGDGDDIVCTITNQRNGTINIVKEATPADDTTFSFTHNVGTGGSFTLQDPADTTETFANVPPGDYTITEGTTAGWGLTNITCSEDQTANSTENEANRRALITLDPGETVTCTFQNSNIVDLEITIGESSDPVVAGSGGGSDNLVHTITVTNHGPGTATNLVVEFTSNTTTAPTLNFSTGGNPTVSNQWEIASLGPNSSATLTLTWDVGAAYNEQNPITSSASVEAVDQTDTDDSNDSDSESTSVTRDVRLTLAKAVNSGSADPGGVLIYWLTATNSGISTASGIVFTDTVPPNTTFNAPSSTSGWSCADGAPAGTVCTLNFGAVATITGNGGTGRVTFAVNILPSAYPGIIVNNASVRDTVSNATASASSRTANYTLHLTSEDDGTIDGLAFKDEDILLFDPATGSWSLHFDGSDVGITDDIYDFALLTDSSILMAFKNPINVPGVGSVARNDVVQFFPATLGDSTNGTFALVFDGSDVGLASDGEDIDAVAVTNNGRLILSTTGSWSVPGPSGTLSGSDEDLIIFNATTLGPLTSGTFELLYDGSDVDMSSEDVNGTWVDYNTGNIYLTTTGDFSVTGLSGKDEDIFAFDPTTTGPTTAGTYGPGLLFDGSTVGFTWRVNGLALGHKEALLAVTTPPPTSSADLAITLSEDNDPATVGDAVTYTAVVNNLGPDAASSVQAQIVVDSPLLLQSYSSSSGSCSDSFNFSTGQTTITCALGSMVSGANVTITIETEATAAGTANNTATVNSNTTDPTPGNNNASATTTVNDGSSETGTVLYLSATGSGSVGGVSYEDEDILAYFVDSNSWTKLFDGSIYGITQDIDAFHLTDNGSIYFSLDSEVTVPGAGLVDDSDIVFFDSTTGLFTLFFDGSAHDLTTSDEDIDGLDVDSSGNLWISFTGTAHVNGTSLEVRDEDVVRFNVSTSTWDMQIDNSDAGYSDDVDALWLDGSDAYFSLNGSFAAVGAERQDVFIMHVTQFGNSTAGTYGPGLFFDASAVGFSGDVDGLHVMLATP